MEYAGPLLLSIQSSTLALILFLPLAIPVGWLLARKNFPGKSLVEVIVMAPLVMPPLVTGYLLLLLFSPASGLGSFMIDVLGVRIPFTIVGAGMAGGLVSFPLMVRTIQQRFASLDTRLEGSARTMGASGFDTFFSITLPQAFPGVAAAGLIGFARSFGEFGATVILAGNIPGKTQTIPSAIYSALNVPGGETRTLIYVLISIVVSVAAVLATYLLTGSGAGAKHD